MIDQNFTVRSEVIREIHRYAQISSRILYLFTNNAKDGNTMALGKQYKQIQCANDLYLYQNKTTSD